MTDKVAYQPLHEDSSDPPQQLEQQQGQEQPRDLEEQQLPSHSPSSSPVAPPPSFIPPPSYESISQTEKEESPKKKCSRKRGRCGRLCVACCSCYGIFCFTWTLLMMCLLCFTMSYYASVVDHCINPPVTYETVEYINIQEHHPNLYGLEVFISVVSGSIRLERSDNTDVIVKVIRGAGDQATLDEQTSFHIEYNKTHLALIGETPSTLFDCPTVQIIVQVPSVEVASKKWTLQVETGHVHISEFYGSQVDMSIHLKTGAVQLDDLVVKTLEVMTNAGAIYWNYGGSWISEQARLLTNSGYIRLEDASQGSFYLSTNTGVINLRKINTDDKVEVESGWGIVRLNDVDSKAGVYISSDSAFVSLQNEWSDAVLFFKTESGSLDLDHLENWESKDKGDSTRVTFGKNKDQDNDNDDGDDDDKDRRNHKDDEEEPDHPYFVSTRSGVVTLYDL